ncbi:hypothetical protein ACFX16_029160 [Malus domestica]
MHSCRRGGNLYAEGDPGAEMRSQVLATVHDLDTFKEFQPNKTHREELAGAAPGVFGHGFVGRIPGRAATKRER